MKGNEFIKTEEFAGTIQKTDNYYVIVTRESYLHCHTVQRKFMVSEHLENMGR